MVKNWRRPEKKKIKDGDKPIGKRSGMAD